MKKCFIPIASDFLELVERQKLIKSYLGILSHYKIEQSSKPKEDCDNYFFILTGGTEKIFLKLIQDFQDTELIRIIAIGINNSLPAALEILAHINQEGKQGQLYYLKNANDYDGLSD